MSSSDNQEERVILELGLPPNPTSFGIQSRPGLRDVRNFLMTSAVSTRASSSSAYPGGCVNSLDRLNKIYSDVGSYCRSHELVLHDENKSGEACRNAMVPKRIHLISFKTQMYSVARRNHLFD
ncbi:hypothetical protein L1887_10169 [Cichorium endivia]|nr:hypothetical protein L1887_10169 [Cichorium endivia]